MEQIFEKIREERKKQKIKDRQLLIEIAILAVAALESQERKKS